MARFYTFGILLSIILFFAITNLFWLIWDSMPPAWDQSGHMLLSYKYYNFFSSIKSIDDLKHFFSVSNYYPPFFHISTVPVIFILGFSEDRVVLVNFFYLSLLVTSLFGMGRLLFNRRAGIFAVLFTLLCPIVYALSREYLIDFALVGMVTATQYLILKSDGGRRSAWNVLLGVAAGFTLLTKTVSIIFFAPLWIFINWEGIKNRKDFASVLVSIAVCLAIALPWHLAVFSDLLKLNGYWQNFATVVEKDPRGFFPSIVWYGRVLKNTLISQNLLFFLVLGFILFLIFDKRVKILIVLMACVVPACLFLVLMPNKDARYIMPVLPAATLLAAGGIGAMKNSNMKKIIYFAIALIGFIQFGGLTFAMPSFLAKHEDSFYGHAPLRQDWKIEEILRCIEGRMGRKRITVGILPDCEHFSPSNFALYVHLLKLPYAVEGFGNFHINPDEIRRYDILIIKFPRISVDYVSFHRNVFYEEMDRLGYDAFGFIKMAEFELPDDSRAFIYCKKTYF